MFSSCRIKESRKKLYPVEIARKFAHGKESKREFGDYFCTIRKRAGLNQIKERIKLKVFFIRVRHAFPWRISSEYKTSLNLSMQKAILKASHTARM